MKHNLDTASSLFSELHMRSSPRKLSIMWPRIRKSSITWPRLPTQRQTINVISSNFGVKLPIIRLLRHFIGKATPPVREAGYTATCQKQSRSDRVNERLGLKSSA